MILTPEIFEQGKSKQGGWNAKQLSFLGITKLYKGWKKDILNKEFPDETVAEFLNYKDAHIKNAPFDLPIVSEKNPVLLDPRNIILTKELFFQGKGSRGGWNYKQMIALGEEPLHKGWFKRLIGKEITPEAFQEFLRLTNGHIGPKSKAVQKRFGESVNAVSHDLHLQEQYAHVKWHEVRMRILARDKYTCSICKMKKKGLQVHHTVYPINKFIWEIEEKYLMAVCRVCHQLLHEHTFEEFKEERN